LNRLPGAQETLEVEKGHDQASDYQEQDEQKLCASVLLVGLLQGWRVADGQASKDACVMHGSLLQVLQLLTCSHSIIARPARAGKEQKQQRG
jgi:hypothetical protein